MRRAKAANKLLRYIGEIGFAWRSGAKLKSKVRLSLDTLAFHLLSKDVSKQGEFRRYGIVVNGKSLPVFLRLRDGDVFIFYEVLYDDVYNTSQLGLPRNANIIDLGANIGLSMIRFAAQHSASRIFCVEPDPGNFNGLLKNARFFGNRVQAVQAAISGASGTVRFSDRGKSYERRIEPQGVAVPALSIVDVIRRSEFERVDLLKVDIEGAEVELFSGDLSWLNRVDAIMIELHGELNEADFAAIVGKYGLEYQKGKSTPTAIRIKKAR